MRKIKVCDKCLSSEFLIDPEGILSMICKNCKALYVWNDKIKEWILQDENDDQKQFLNETIN